MSDNNLYQITKSNNDIIITVVTNTIKMLYERSLLAKDKLDETIQKQTKTLSDDLMFKVTLTDKAIDNCIIKIIQQKITSVSKSSNINDFLTLHKNNMNVLIVKSISKKARQYILTNYPRTEIFFEDELMINLVDHEFVPKHEVLSEDESKAFFEAYLCKKRNMPKLYSTDPVARYYNMKVGDVCRIIRPSETSGFVAFYRLVIKGSF